MEKRRLKSISPRDSWYHKREKLEGKKFKVVDDRGIWNKHDTVEEDLWGFTHGTFYHKGHNYEFLGVKFE